MRLITLALILFLLRQSFLLLRTGSVDESADRNDTNDMKLKCANQLFQFDDQIPMDYLRREYSKKQTEFSKCNETINEFEFIQIEYLPGSVLIELDMEKAMRQNINLSNADCALYPFDKATNVPEKSEFMLGYSHLFERMSRKHRVMLSPLNDAVFFYLECAIGSAVAYNNVLVVLPRDMAKLREKAEYNLKRIDEAKQFIEDPDFLLNVFK